MYKLAQILLFNVLLITSIYAEPAKRLNPIEMASQSVVNITAMTHPKPGQPEIQKPRGQFDSLGSGVIIDSKNGLIVTNMHVVDNAELIFVTLHNGTRLYGTMIGGDYETDLAIVKINHPDLMAIPIQTSTNSIHVGDQVIAIGNPFGLDHTITSGIVSGLHRSVPPTENMIQTDAPINPGNSGGALINDKGELVGICTAITTISGGNLGIGFATPIDIMLPITQQLIEFGSVSRTRVGLMIQNLTPPLSRALGLKDNSGVLVSDVVPGSPASVAKVLPEDIIVGFNDVNIESSNQLRSLIGTVRKGKDLSLKLIRQKQELTLKVKLEDTKEQKPIVASRIDGAELIEYEQLDPQGNIIKGLYIINVNEGSPAFLAGLIPQDLILEIDRKPIGSLKNLNEVIQKTTSKESLIRIRRQNHFLFLALR